VEGAGLILQHCRRAKSALVVSSMGVYSAHDDPFHRFDEFDPIGRGATAYAATSPATKLGMEAVARFCARAFDLKVTIARLNTVLGVPGAYFSKLIEGVAAGQPFRVPHVPNPHSPIHTEDMQAQIEALLDAAAVPALVVNWCGDEVVTTQAAARTAGELLGCEPKLLVVDTPGAPKGNAANAGRRLAITGPCGVRFDPAFRRLCEQLGD
jgi:nucleoside-diphosphate-sugar epimerase